MVQLLPSILSADFARLADQVAAAERGGGSTIHVDIMDGHFVPNITIGPPVVKSLRKATTLPLDCHLMIDNPNEFIPAFAEAGADWVSVHYEACTHLHRTLQLIAQHGMKPGVVLNPATPVELVIEVLPMVHQVLIMSVNPGFGGQSFIESALRKLERARKWIDRCGRDIRLQVDGGIKVENIRRAADAGADTFVAGSAIFGSSDYRSVIEAMRARLGGVTPASRVA
jgi:ribulose-phosphate 3-epimerase